MVVSLAGLLHSLLEAPKSFWCGPIPGSWDKENFSYNIKAWFCSIAGAGNVDRAFCGKKQGVIKLSSPDC